MRLRILVEDFDRRVRTESNVTIDIANAIVCPEKAHIYDGSLKENYDGCPKCLAGAGFPLKNVIRPIAEAVERAVEIPGWRFSHRTAGS